MSTYCSNCGKYITPACGEIDLDVYFSICNDCSDSIKENEENNEKPVKNT